MANRKFILSHFGLNKPFEFLFPYIVDYGVVAWLKSYDSILKHLLENNENKIYLFGGEKSQAPFLDPPVISVIRQELVIDRDTEGFFGSGDYLFPYPRSGRLVEGIKATPSGIGEFPFPDDYYEGSGHLVNMEYRRGLYNIDYWTLVANPHSQIGLHYFFEVMHQIFRNRADRFILQSVPHPETVGQKIELGYFPIVLILEGMQDLSTYEAAEREERILRAQASVRVYAPCIVESIKDESIEKREITVEGVESSSSTTIEKIYVDEYTEISE